MFHFILNVHVLVNIFYVFTLKQVKAESFNNKPCESILVEYNRQCYKRCPNGAVFDSGNRICQHVNTDVSGKEASYTSIPKLKNYVHCPSNFCSSERPFCYNIQCYDSCPYHTFSVGKNCFDDCPVGYLRMNTTCVTECPSECPYRDGNSCVQYCSSSKVLFQNTCMEHCPNGYFIFNNKCLERCLATTFIFSHGNKSYCVDRCPEYTSVNGSNCQLHCPESDPILYDRKCVSSCPNESRFLVILTTAYNSFITCLSACPNDTYLEGKSCVDTCSDGNVLVNNTCIDECPSTKPLTVHPWLEDPNLNARLYPKENKVCAAECPLSYFKINNDCYSSCPRTTYIMGDQCVANCPSTHPVVYGKTCTEKCPGLSMGNTCLQDIKCPSELKELNSKCVLHCPSTHPFIQTRRKPVSVYGYIQYAEVKICISECPSDSFKYQNMCLSDCPENARYALNNSCIQTCPESEPIQYLENVHNTERTRFYCVNECPDHAVLENGTCKDHCQTSETPFHFNGTCINQCPELHPFIDVSHKNACVDSCSKYTFGNFCVLNCPEPTVLFNFTCLSHCPQNFFLEPNGRYCTDKCPRKHYNKTCLENCPTYFKVLNTTCVPACPDEFYVQAITKKRGWDRNWYWKSTEPTCVKNCSPDLLIYKTKCLTQCPKTSRFSLANNCLETCPSSHPFLFNTKNGIYDRFSCLQKCPNLRIEGSDTCVDECPPTKAKYKRWCVSSCPSTFPYKFYKTEKIKSPKCSAICPKEYVIDRERCIIECASNKKYLVGRKCKSRCPDSFPYINVETDNAHWPSKQRYRCVAECPKKMVYEASFCKRSCSGKLKYRLLQHCYDVCPEDTPLHFAYTNHATMQTLYTCVRRCPENSYLINKTCALFCPKEFFGFNEQCIEHCPYSHPKNYTKIMGSVSAYFCVKVCPNNSYRLKEKCFDHCPLSTVTFRDECLDECPETHRYHSTHVKGNMYNSVFCVSKCPNLTHTSTCVSSCPTDFPFIYKRKCLQECPKDKPFARTDGVRNCYSRCPVDTALYQNNQCVSKCPDSLPNILNGKCVNRCSPLYKYYEVSETGIVCKLQCTKDQVRNIKECVQKCPMHKLNVDGICKSLSKCPNSIPYVEDRKQGRTCTAKCSDGNYLEENVCQEGCSLGNVIYNGSCVNKCPQSSPYELYESALNYSNKIMCHSSCPKGHVSEGLFCITESKCHKSNKTIDKGTCVAECKEGDYMTDIGDKRTCNSKCPTNYYINGTNCLKCDESDLLLHQKHCIPSCPEDTIQYKDRRTYPSRTICIPLSGYKVGLTINVTLALIAGFISWIILPFNCIERCYKCRRRKKHSDGNYDKVDNEIDDLDEFDLMDIDTYMESEAKDLTVCDDEETLLLKIDHRDSSQESSSEESNNNATNHEVMIHNVVEASEKEDEETCLLKVDSCDTTLSPETPRNSQENCLGHHTKPININEIEKNFKIMIQDANDLSENEDEETRLLKIDGEKPCPESRNSKEHYSMQDENVPPLNINCTGKDKTTLIQNADDRSENEDEETCLLKLSSSNDVNQSRDFKFSEERDPVQQEHTTSVMSLVKNVSSPENNNWNKCNQLGNATDEKSSVDNSEESPACFGTDVLSKTFDNAYVCRKSSHPNIQNKGQEFINMSLFAQDLNSMDDSKSCKEIDNKL